LSGDNRLIRLTIFLARSSPGQKNRVIVLRESGISRIGNRVTLMYSLVIWYASFYEKENAMDREKNAS
jgi:hypothetical protein